MEKNIEKLAPRLAVALALVVGSCLRSLEQSVLADCREERKR
jgi:hypothetical protein